MRMKVANYTVHCSLSRVVPALLEVPETISRVSLIPLPALNAPFTC